MRCTARPKSNFPRRLLGLCTGSVLMAAQAVWALGTPAGTSIANSASLSYMVGPGVPAVATSNTVTLRVDEVIQPLLTWQDAAPVAVSTPASDSVLSFLLTNAGNGSESFALARINGPPPLPPGNYTPQNGSIGSIYLESGLQAGFQASGPNADTAYVAGTNDPALAPDASLIVYVISDTPSVAANAQGKVLLNAAALTPGAAGAAPGTGLAGLGQGGGFAVVGSSGAQANATGIMIASGIGLLIAKTVQSVLDPQGTAVVMSGSVLTYRIATTLSGAGTASNLTITDPLPAGTTYVPGSIAVNGLARSDAADADNAQYIVATRTVSVALGNVAAPANILITLRAIID
ncbi:MAG: DUF11 domain-containing protein [Sulfuritalea sp.]|nr:DUF11 domain-containing protein [Sulfuritalea sp.]